MRVPLIAILFSFTLPVVAQPLTWYIFDLPPIYVVKGPDKGKGQVDGHVRFLMDHLPEYETNVEIANIPRILAELKSGRSGVVAGVQKTGDRESYLKFSIPFLSASTPRLAVRKADLSKFKEFEDVSGRLDLGALIDSGRFTLGLVSGRSYGTTIDKLISDRPGSPNIIARASSTDLSVGQLAMLEARRIDVALVFIGEFDLFLAGKGKNGTDLTTVFLQNIPDEFPIYIVAPKTAEGTILINKINALIRKYWNDQEFRATAFYSMTPSEQADRKRFLAKGPEAETSP